MKRVAMIGAVLAVAAFSFAQSNSKPDAPAGCASWSASTPPRRWASVHRRPRLNLSTTPTRQRLP